MHVQLFDGSVFMLSEPAPDGTYTCVRVYRSSGSLQPDGAPLGWVCVGVTVTSDSGDRVRQISELRVTEDRPYITPKGHFGIFRIVFAPPSSSEETPRFIPASPVQRILMADGRTTVPDTRESGLQPAVTPMHFADENTWPGDTEADG